MGEKITTTNKKYHALMFWPDSIETSVIKRKRLPDNAEVGETHDVTFSGEVYKGKILEFSEDRKYLKTIEVTNKGEIINPKEHINTKKEEELRRKASLRQIEKGLFEDDLTDDTASVGIPKPTQKSAEDEIVPEKGDILTPESDVSFTLRYSSSENTPERHSPINRQHTMVEENYDLQKGDGSNQSRQRDISYRPQITRDQIIPALQQIIRLLKEDEEPEISANKKRRLIRSPQQKSPLKYSRDGNYSMSPGTSKHAETCHQPSQSPHSLSAIAKKYSTPKSRYEPSVAYSNAAREDSGRSRSGYRKQHSKSEKREKTSSGMIEIQPYTSVYVSENYLVNEVDKFRRRPSEMVRRIMLYILGADRLRDMTARGNKRFKPVPPNVLEAVKYYIDRHAVCDVPETEYIRFINEQCGTIRNPKVEKALQHAENKDSQRENSDEEMP